MTIPAVGPVTALTWALEVGEVQRFSSIKKAISYCGLCGAESRSADTIKRTPLSKQRNKHLQCVLVEAAKMAPRNSPALAMIRSGKAERQRQSRHPRGGTEAGSVLDGGRSPSRELSCRGERKPHCRVAAAESQEVFFSARPARSCFCRLGDGA